MVNHGCWDSPYCETTEALPCEFSIIYVLNIIYFNEHYNFLNVKTNSTDENNHLYNVLITVQNIPPFKKKLLTTGSYVYCAMYTCDVILLLKVGHLHTILSHIYGYGLDTAAVEFSY